MLVKLIIIGVFCGIALALVLVGLLLMRSGVRMQGRCSACTMGKVVGVSNMKAMDYIHLLNVEYEAEGKTYRVAGPKFSSVRYSIVKTPHKRVRATFISNLDGCTAETLPARLECRVDANSAVSIARTPLLDLFPIGTEVPVWYDPENPNTAYAFRWCRPIRWTAGVGLVATGIGLAILGIACFVLLPVPA